MLKLLNDFQIISISTDYYRLNQNTAYQSKSYVFFYKSYKIKLRIQFNPDKYIEEPYIRIHNFGYEVYVYEWLDQHDAYVAVKDCHLQSSSITKKYLDSKDARILLLRFVEKTIDRFLQKVSPLIVTRGPFDHVTCNQPRYKMFDKIFFQHNYFKEESFVKDYRALQEDNSSHKNNILWIYSKDPKQMKFYSSLVSQAL